MANYFRILLLYFAILTIIPLGSAFASCTSSDSAICKSGRLDTQRAIGNIKPDPCADEREPGTVCDDGSVYAGNSPDGNVPMFTTPADAGQFSWNDGTANYVATKMQNCRSASPGAQPTCRTGRANTDLLSALGKSPSPAPYVAARYCDDLVAHGHSDWYLPAQDELNVLWSSRAAIGRFNLSGSNPTGYYWSSSDFSHSGARGQSFRVGFQISSNKTNRLSVRCVRK